MIKTTTSCRNNYPLPRMCISLCFVLGSCSPDIFLYRRTPLDILNLVFTFSNYVFFKWIGGWGGFWRAVCSTFEQPPEVFYKKAVLGNFAIFTEKHLSWDLFLIKFQARRPATLFDSNTGKKNYEIFKNTYFEEHLRAAADNWRIWSIK